MDNRGKGINRMDMRTHVDEIALSMRRNELDDQTGESKEDDKALDKLAQIAALADHPGWKQMRAMFKSKAKEYRLLTPMEAIITDTNVSNDMFGSNARACLWVAKELESFIDVIETAATVVTAERQNRKQERARDESGKFVRQP